MVLKLLWSILFLPPWQWQKPAWQQPHANSRYCVCILVGVQVDFWNHDTWKHNRQISGWSFLIKHYKQVFFKNKSHIWSNVFGNWSSCKFSPRVQFGNKTLRTMTPAIIHWTHHQKMIITDFTCEKESILIREQKMGGEKRVTGAHSCMFSEKEYKTMQPIFRMFVNLLIKWSGENCLSHGSTVPYWEQIITSLLKVFYLIPCCELPHTITVRAPFSGSMSLRSCL